jgi:ribonucleoside-diphosphate reductase alpha chain
MPDYIMRWLASRFIDDPDVHEDLGILTAEVRARKEAQQALFLAEEGPAGNGRATNGHGNGTSNGHGEPEAGAEAATADAAESRPPTEALTDTPPVRPAMMFGLDLGPACEQCGGMMQRTGSCYTCSSCGNNTGCG